MNNTSNSIVKAYQDYLGDNLISIVLFGSMTRGEARKDSDYDLFIIAKNLPQDRFKRIRFLHEPDIVVKEGISIIGKEPPGVRVILALTLFRYSFRWHNPL